MSGSDWIYEMTRKIMWWESYHQEWTFILYSGKHTQCLLLFDIIKILCSAYWVVWNSHLRPVWDSGNQITDIFSQLCDSHMGAKVAEEYPSSFSDSQTPRSELLCAIVRGRKPVNPHQVCLAVIFNRSLELRVELYLLWNGNDCVLNTGMA